MTERQAIEFIDNIGATNMQYVCITVDVLKVLNSWRQSVFSFQWLHPDGRLKNIDELSEDERPKRENIETSLKKGKPIAKPILGIGINENIEIGTGCAVLLTMAAHGVQTIQVHIPKSNESDFHPFLADLNP